MLSPENLQNGQEQYESFQSSIARRTVYQYDFRAEDGALFSCVGKSLKECRARKDAWLSKREK